MAAPDSENKFVSSENLHLELPIIIDELLYAHRCTAECLAQIVGIGHSTLGRWHQGIPSQVERKAYDRLLKCHVAAQPALLLKGVHAENLVCCCNLSDSYDGDFRTDARRPLTWLLRHPEGMSGRGIKLFGLDIHVRSASLPSRCPSIVFTNKPSESGVNQNTFIILTNYNAPKREQWQFVQNTIFYAIRPSIQAALSPEFPRRINLRPSVSASPSFSNLPSFHHPDTFETQYPGHADDDLQTPDEIYDAVYDLCYGAQCVPKILAPLIGISRPTLTRWLQGAVVPSMGAAITELGRLRAAALRIIRMRFLNPADLFLFANWDVPPPREHVEQARAALVRMLQQVGQDLTQRPLGITLDLIARSAPVASSVSAHCFTNLASPPDSFVILSNPKHTILEQCNTVFDEIYAHVTPQFQKM